jgi:hypothetical protein
MSSKDEKCHDSQDHPELREGSDVEIGGTVEINAAGYEDQLKRQYGLWGIIGIALTVDNAWAALGSSISVSIRKRTLI